MAGQILENCFFWKTFAVSPPHKTRAGVTVHSHIPCMHADAMVAQMFPGIRDHATYNERICRSLLDGVLLVASRSRVHPAHAQMKGTPSSKEKVIPSVRDNGVDQLTTFGVIWFSHCFESHSGTNTGCMMPASQRSRKCDRSSHVVYPRLKSRPHQLPSSTPFAFSSRILRENFRESVTWLFGSQSHCSSLYAAGWS
ncbi:conserved hypothetical protein [Coccidioides posadasii str. Silveira]|uniref:Uncharacterized protein n=1 Tax=Coccidioides posadasii (strain RMSCC 757 / Silveira) TaxID=443226 RepID=E9D9K1_COCPS|nr:conserved hypothetical protein [Coccidioides posadasii str. Silveira]